MDLPDSILLPIMLVLMRLMRDMLPFDNMLDEELVVDSLMFLCFSLV